MRQEGDGWGHLAVHWRDGDVVITLHGLQTFLEPHQGLDDILVVTRDDLQLVLALKISKISSLASC